MILTSIVTRWNSFLNVSWLSQGRRSKLIPAVSASALVAGGYFVIGIEVVIWKLTMIRSICPGMIMAETSLYISCAMILSVFNISKAVENGKVITPKMDPTTGLIRFVPLVMLKQ